MEKLDVPALPQSLIVADKLMVPIMIALRGFRLDSLQETHTWHPFPINPEGVDLSMAVPNHGSDLSRYRQHNSFLFHAPILGGWKDYSVYEVDEDNAPFRIGWVTRRADTGQLVEAAVHRLLIDNNRIRMLDGSPDFKGHFFAVNSDGQQIPLHLVGKGRIGDEKYRDVRLF